MILTGNGVLVIDRSLGVLQLLRIWVEHLPERVLDFMLDLLHDSVDDLGEPVVEALLHNRRQVSYELILVGFLVRLRHVARLSVNHNGFVCHVQSHFSIRLALALINV